MILHQITYNGWYDIEPNQTKQGYFRFGRPLKTYIHQLCVDTECDEWNLPRAIADRDVWRERFKGICSVGMSWW